MWGEERLVGSCEHLKLPEDLLLCNLGNTSRSLLIEGICVMKPQICCYFTLSRYLCYESSNLLLLTVGCKGRRHVVKQVEEQDPEELMDKVACAALPRLASSGTTRSLSQRTQILYPFQQEDKRLTENWWFSIMFLSIALLHIDQIKSNALCCELQNQQHHMYWHVFCKLWRKEMCRYCVRAATHYIGCKLVCSKLLHVVKLHPWERSLSPACRCSPSWGAGGQLTSKLQSWGCHVLRLTVRTPR